MRFTFTCEVESELTDETDILLIIQTALDATPMRPYIDFAELEVNELEDEGS
ncbi:hypothetical protein LCGC14_0294820 [marine sediment metagenome]|uniref:Uncharacterized protein n=1 Tax=marine sediment metagenome TaxID=412755 RepID=A0A0F9TX21_9ZZZZ